MILPARWFTSIARDSYLKGSTLWEMGIAFLALAVLCVLMIALAARTFKKDLEP
jgi:ABC-type multidrug transport system permease subunit